MKLMIADKANLNFRISHQDHAKPKVLLQFATENSNRSKNSTQSNQSILMLIAWRQLAMLSTIKDEKHQLAHLTRRRPTRQGTMRAQEHHLNAAQPNPAAQPLKS